MKFRLGVSFHAKCAFLSAANANRSALQLAFGQNNPAIEAPARNDFAQYAIGRYGNPQHPACAPVISPNLSIYTYLAPYEVKQGAYAVTADQNSVSTYLDNTKNPYRRKAPVNAVHYNGGARRSV